MLVKEQTDASLEDEAELLEELEELEAQQVMNQFDLPLSKGQKIRIQEPNEINELEK